MTHDQPLATTSSTPVQSMTGFGRATVRNPQELIEIDLRSVNNKNFKAQIKVPEHLIPLLPRLENTLKNAIERGSVSLTIRHRTLQSQRSYDLNIDQLKRYYDALKPHLEQNTPLRITELVNLPGIVNESAEETDLDELWQHIEPQLSLALSALQTMRQQEGQGIALDLTHCLQQISQHLAEISQLIPLTLSEYQQKLQLRISRLLAGSEQAPDPRELAQQVAFFADRSDISEEVQRLHSHITSTSQTLQTGGAVGRKLEFLSQEMQREANTMVSKSHGLAIINHALAIKLLVEKIREQTANLE